MTAAGRGWLAVLALPLLAGCVAAAIPVIAAGGLVTTQSDLRGAPADTRPRVALPADPSGADAEARGQATIVRDYTLSDGTQVTVTNSLSGAEPTAAAPVEPADDGPIALTAATTFTAPSTVTADAVRPAELGGDYTEFAAFARRQAAVPAVGGERLSAMLADSSQLEPETRTCSIHPAAVLIDIDPGDQPIDTARPHAADPTLAASLGEMRRDGIEIGWVSSRTADRAGEIRKALAASGLDPDGRDELVLLRFAEERKQTRREDFAKAHCVLAIAGDERADFDELFAYLLDPTAASPLDALIGKGWFLVPSPLN